MLWYILDKDGSETAVKDAGQEVILADGNKVTVEGVSQEPGMDGSGATGHLALTNDVGKEVSFVVRCRAEPESGQGDLTLSDSVTVLLLGKRTSVVKAGAGRVRVPRSLLDPARLQALAAEMPDRMKDPWPPGPGPDPVRKNQQVWPTPFQAQTVEPPRENWRPSAEWQPDHDAEDET